ncbi:pseudouridine synthase [Chitinophagaceae bacterium MMS25-I14]
MKKHYYIFYKPFQVLTQFSPEGDKKTLSDFFQHFPKDIYPVGRLDYDSEGMLLLTNDKALTYRLLEPKFAHHRTYYVQVEGVPGKRAIEALQDGVTISINGRQHHTMPATAFLFDEAPVVPERNPPIRYRKEIPASWISLTLTEGKNRQVRRMTAAVGFPTLRLIRYSIGSINIEGMQPGEYKELSAAQVQRLFLQDE